MKRSVWFAALFLLLLAGRQAAAQNAVGISEIAYDPESDTVAGYSATELDYTACYYYDAYVVGGLYLGNQLADSGASFGVCSAEVFTDSPASAGVWTVLSDHYVVPVDFEPDDGYYDPFGFDLFGGEYGSGYSFYGCWYCGGFSWEELIYLGSTEVSITVPPPCSKQPTLTASASHVTRAGTVTFTLGNLCPTGQRTIQDWTFTDTGGTPVQRGASNITTWSGTLVTSGTVSVTVNQGEHTYTPSASVTVDKRTGFAFAAVQPRKVPLPQSCGQAPIVFPSPPADTSDVGRSCLDVEASRTPAQVTDSGPNQSYRYIGEAHDTSDYFYVLSADVENTNGDFFRHQCGDYTPATGAGFISGAQLLADAQGHESGATNSHYQEYVDAQNDPAKNLGVGLEAMVGLPTESQTSFLNRADTEAARRRDVIMAAYAVEPCRTGEVRGAGCEVHGPANVVPYAPCRPTELSATAVSSAQVNLSWKTDSLHKDGFVIERGPLGVIPFEIGRVSETQTTYKDTTVSAGTTYNYVVQAFTGNLYSNLSNTASVQTPAAVSLSPATLTFATQTVGTTSPGQPATLTNPAGNPPLAISGVAAGGEFAATSGCGPTLAAGSSCTISVTFTPSAAGARTGMLTVSDNAPGSPRRISLSGNGLAAKPKVALAPPAVTFAGQNVGTTSAAQAITVTNTGTASLTIASVTPSGDFQVQSNSCIGTLAVNASCTVGVVCAPSAVGARTGTLTFVDSADDSPQTVALSGTGTIVSLAPASLTFAGQVVGTTSAPQTLTLTNSTATPLSITSIVPIGDFVATSGCGASLAAGASCTISVAFTPFTAGARTGSLSVNADRATSPTSIALAGTGLPLVPSLSALAPATVTAGSPGFTLVVTGSNFNRDAVVRVNGSDRPTTYVYNPTWGLPLQLRATLTAADVAAAGSLSITAVNPGGGGGESTALPLTVTSTPIPLITGVSPVRVRAGTASVALTLSGSNFPANAMVFVNGVSHATTWISGSQLTVTLSGAEIAASGILTLSVASLSGGSNAVPFVVFRYGDVNFDTA
ncbi:MAG TPA: choice-of-anchor D domain-containing protein, partial [Thermoanaerobaculia bacterium]